MIFGSEKTRQLLELQKAYDLMVQAAQALTISVRPGGLATASSRTIVRDALHDVLKWIDDTEKRHG